MRKAIIVLRTKKGERPVSQPPKEAFLETVGYHQMLRDTGQASLGEMVGHAL